MTKKVGRTRKRDQATKQRTLWITGDGWDSLGNSAKLAGVSRSELVERIARGDTEAMNSLIKIPPPAHLSDAEKPASR